jgi:hypothetical protein
MVFRNRKECWCSCASASGATHLIDFTSVEQVCMQVRSTQILLLTPLHLELP